MKLSKALKLKNRLAGEIGKLKILIQTHNSVRKGTEREFEVKELLSKLQTRVDQLVMAKTAIAVANAGAVGTQKQLDDSNHKRIFLLAELKGLIEFLKSVPTKHGTFDEGMTFSNSKYEVTYEAFFREKDVSEMVDATQKLIDEAQEEIDAFNASSDVAIDGIKI